MKIAILRKKYTFHGGAEGFSSGLIENLADAGHEIHIFAIKWQSGAAHKNVHFHKVPSITFISFLRDLTFAAFSYFLLKKQRKDFDIIQTHDKTLYQDIYRAGDGCHIEWLRQRWKRTGLAGKLSVVLNPYHWLVLALERAVLNGHKFKKIIAISEMVKRNIIDNYKAHTDDIEVIYNGVDTEKFHPDNRQKYRMAVRQEYGLTDKDFVVLFVGSGFERKGVKYLIEAVKTVPQQVTVMIVGSGKHPPVSPLNKGGIKKGYKQKIIFCGPQKDIHRYYAAADIFVFPTIYEPFGNVHIEALASGLPVITTKNSGASEIIEDGMQGFVVRGPEDIKDIAEKIRFFVNNRERMYTMSKNARSLAEEFTFEKHIGRIKELYERVVAERGTPSP